MSFRFNFFCLSYASLIGLAFAATPAAYSSTAEVITTFAGSHVAGYSGDGGQAINAEMNNPGDVILDKQGNLYLTDTNNNVVRKISPSGIISTLVGTGKAGYSGDNGPAFSAELNSPTYLTFDANGNLYIADTGNNVVRKVTPSGIITTIAGNGKQGHEGNGGPATSAEFYAPVGLAVDSKGNLYISDSANNQVRKVDPSGEISAFAGAGYSSGYSGDGGPAVDALLYFPEGLAIDSNDNVFIADFFNGVIREVNTQGVISTFAGTYYGEFACPAFAHGHPATCFPMGLAFDSEGNLYSSAYGMVVLRITPAAVITDFAGDGAYGYAGDGGAAIYAELELERPGGGVAVDAAGAVFIADSGNSVIRKVARTTSPPTAEPTFTPPAGTYQSGEFVSLSESTPHTVIRYTLDGSMPAATSPEYTTPIFVGENTTINAAAFALGYDSTSPTATADYTIEVPQAYPPTFSIAPGTYNSWQLLDLSDAAPNATIHYTIDGSTPTNSSPVYSKAITVQEDPTVVKAFAIAPGFTAGPVASATYDIVLPGAAAPTFSPKPGTYAGSVSVTMSDTTPGEEIHYTLDGSTPTAYSPLYQGPVTLTQSATVKAISTAYDYWKSVVSSAQYTIIAAVPPPVIVPGSGPATVGQTITMSDTVPTATIYYTLDRTNPTTNSPMYTAPFALPALETIKAIAVEAGNPPSAVATATYIQQPIITAYAGTGTAGYTGDGGPATSADLSSFWDMTLDQAGNLYIADSNNRAVRKVSRDGTITTLLAQPKVAFPNGVAVDKAGNLYIADGGLSVVFKLTPQGFLTTFAGTRGSYGYSGDKGPATSAQLEDPMGLAFDSKGNLYISDQDANVVRLVSTSGVITTYAGNGLSGALGDGGLATKAELRAPFYLAIDAQDNLYIADFLNLKVRKVSPSQIITTFAGGGKAVPGDGGPATSSKLTGPSGLAVDAQGNVYISDNSHIRRVDPTGLFSTYAGNGNGSNPGNGGLAIDATFNATYVTYASPLGLAVDASGNLYIADDYNCEVRKIEPPPAQ